MAKGRCRITEGRTPRQPKHSTREKRTVRSFATHECHPESKCAVAVGNTCDRHTIGLLQCRHSPIDQIKYIGNESNSLEDVEAGRSL